MIRGWPALTRAWSEGRLAERTAALALLALPAVAALGVPPSGLLDIPGGFGALSPIAEFKTLAVRWGYGAALALLAFLCLARPRLAGERAAAPSRTRHGRGHGDVTGTLRAAVGWGLGAYVVSVMLSALMSIAPAFSFWRALDVLLPAALAAVVVAATWRLDAHRFLGAATIVGAVVAAIVLLQHFGINPLAWVYTLQMERPDERAELIATIGNPEYVGGFLAAITSGALVLGCVDVGRGRLLLLAAVPLLLAATLATGTRSSLLAIAAGLAYATAMAVRQRASLRALAVAGGVLLLALIAGAVILSTPNPLNPRLANLAGRFGELLDWRSPSIRERVLTNVAAAELIADRPWLGHGAGMFNARFYDAMAEFAARDDTATVTSALESLNEKGPGAAHNDFLQIWTESGLAGLASFLLMAIALLAMPWAGGTHRDAGRFACQAALATLLASALVSFPLHSPERACLFWALVAHVGSRGGGGAAPHVDGTDGLDEADRVDEDAASATAAAEMAPPVARERGAKGRGKRARRAASR